MAFIPTREKNDITQPSMSRRLSLRVVERLACMMIIKQRLQKIKAAILYLYICIQA